MLKRVADSLYWMSRYIERAENTARLVDVSLQYIPNIEDLDEESLAIYWKPILRSTGDYELYKKLHKETTSETLVNFLTFDLQNPSSIFSCVSAARHNAHMIRDQISMEMWETINRFYHFVKNQDATKVWKDGPYEFYQRVKEFSHLFQGLTDATFTLNEGYHFIKIGKYLERADKTGRILDMKYHVLLPDLGYVGTSLDHSQWGALLVACSAHEAYQKTYLSSFKPKLITEFLILSHAFPRSILFCIERLNDHLHELSGCPKTSYSNEAERICGKLISDLSFKNCEDIFSFGLHEQLQEIEERLAQIGLELGKFYMFYPVIDPAVEADKTDDEVTQTQSNS